MTGTSIQNVIVEYLASLFDVSISSPTNGQALVYNSSTKKWANSSTTADSASSLITPAGWQVKDDGSGNLGFYNPNGVKVDYFDALGSLVLPNTESTLPDSGLNYIASDSSGDLFINGGVNGFIYLRSQGTTQAFIAPSAGLGISSVIYYYNGIVTTGGGVPAEYASTVATPVSIPSTGATVITYTPVTTGLFLVVIVIMCTTTATITLTVTYKDISSTTTATQTLASSVALTANNAATFTALCPAVAGTAITATGTASIGTTDLHGSGSILAL